MKLLFDENLSTRIAAQLQALFPGSVHVTSIVGTAVSDELLWKTARDGGYTIVLKRDRDLVHSEGAPPKVIRLTYGRANVPAMVALFRERYEEISAFHNATKADVLAL